jgi:hypothetical protein
MNILFEHITDILPYYIIFEIFYIYTKKIWKDFNTTYFLLHFIINTINTIILLPHISELLINPLNYILDKSLIPISESYLRFIYPLIIGLHTFHLIHNINKIYYDEIIHHICTHIFWYIIHITNNRLIILSIITMSGIPGGISYLLLFLNKLNKINHITEKKISTYLNIWLRAPLCVVFSTIIYIQTYSNEYLYYYYYQNLFVILFIIINGIHFMHNIIKSYYKNKL